MTRAAAKLKAQLAQLSLKDRAELAQFLVRSLDGEEHAYADPTWEAELDRRLAEIESGQDPGEPAEKMLRELREKCA